MEKILIIGGTNFIGRNLILALMEAKKFDITLFNRGKTNTNVFLELKRITGDRNTEDINKITQLDWDYIIDVSCYLPTSLQRILDNLQHKPKKYIFISTCSVYEIDQTIMKNENSAVLECSPQAFQNTEMYEFYGNKKVACEQLLEVSDLNYTILRPSLVYGAYDHTDRFYYWLHQVQHFDNILIPSHGKDLFSVTYVQDLVQSILLSLKTDIDRNAYNVTSTTKISILQIVETAAKILKKQSNLVNASSSFLNELGIQKWTEMPLWLDCDFYTFDNKKLLNNYKISIVSLEESIRATIGYYKNLNWQTPIFGMNREKQLELLSLCQRTTNK